MFVIFTVIIYLCFVQGQLHLTCYDSKEDRERYCLSFINISLSWEQAKSYCFDKGGRLASIQNDEIDMTIADKIETERSWIGGFKDNVTGKWLWVSGEEVVKNVSKTGGECTLYVAKINRIFSNECKTMTTFICQFSSENYTFCIPYESQQYSLCYNYIGKRSNWCSARDSCIRIGEELASLDRDIGGLKTILFDILNTTSPDVFVGAVKTDVTWIWLNGKNVSQTDAGLIHGQGKCAVLSYNNRVKMIASDTCTDTRRPFLCSKDPENTVWEYTSSTSVCAQWTQMPTQVYKSLIMTTNGERSSLSPVLSTPKDSQTSAPETLSAVFTSRTASINRTIMSSDQGRLTSESVTLNSLQVASNGISAKGRTISIPLLTSSLTNSTEKSPPHLSKTQTKASNSSASSQMPASPKSKQAIILGTSIGGGVFVIAAILIIILQRRRQLSAKRRSIRSNDLPESTHEFSIKALSRNLEHQLTFIENPFYEATNINSSNLGK